MTKKEHAAKKQFLADLHTAGEMWLEYEEYYTIIGVCYTLDCMGYQMVYDSTDEYLEHGRLSSINGGNRSERSLLCALIIAMVEAGDFPVLAKGGRLTCT